MNRAEKAQELREQVARLDELIDAMNQPLDALEQAVHGRPERSDVIDFAERLLKPLREERRFLLDWIEALAPEIDEQFVWARCEGNMIRAFGPLGMHAWLKQSPESKAEFMRRERERIEVMRGERKPRDCWGYSGKPDDDLHRYGQPYEPEERRWEEGEEVGHATTEA